MTTPNTNFDPTSYPQPQPDLRNMDPVQGYNAPFAQQYAEATPAWDPLAPTHHTWNIQHVPAPPVKKKRVWPWVLGGFVIAGMVSLFTLGAIVDNIDPSIDNGTAIGDIALSPTNGNLQDTYTSGVGELDLDLTALTPLEQERGIQVSSGVGEVNILLPENIPVNLTCMAGIGTTHCDVEGLNDNANPDSEPLNIHVNSGIGDVQVEYAG